jgi:predicted amidohydrolase YtcJ
MLTRICLLLALMTNMTYAADTIVINAKVITVDRDHPAAEAFAIDNGRFTAVGTNAEILALKTQGQRLSISMA